MEIRPRSLLWGVALCLLGAPASADTLQQQAEGQRTRAALESRIEAADDDVRERLEELRRLERETRQLSARSDALAPRLEHQAEALDRREAALATLGETREALPDLQRRLVERLARWVDRDLPFLVDERRARVASLERGLGDPDASAAERLESVLAAWRAELDYGREFDAWRGTLEEGETRREVEFLRLGRIGLYYLTPDGRQGGVWRTDEGRWVALDEPARRQLRHGLHIARDRRAPELLHLPLSVSLAASSASDREMLP